MRDILVNTGVVIVSTVISLVAIEAVLHAFDSRHFIPYRGSGKELARDYYVADPDMGYDIRKNVAQNTFTFAHGTFTIFSNSYGCFEKEAPVPDKYILMIGDSMVWGYAPYEHKWGTRLEEILDRRIVKCGLSASGTAHQLIKAKRTVERVGHNPQIIILGYYGNDFPDDFVFPQQVVIDGIRTSNVKKIDLKNGEVTRFSDDELRGSLNNISRGEVGLKGLIARNSVVANILWERVKGTQFHAAFGDILGHIRNPSTVNLRRMRDDGIGWVEEVWRRHLQNVLKIKSFAQEIGAELVIFLIPSPRRRDYSDIEPFLRKHDIMHLDLSRGLYQIVGSPENLKDLHWRFDGHWNNWGNEAAALVSARFLVRQGRIWDVPDHLTGKIEDLITDLGRTLKNAR